MRSHWCRSPRSCSVTARRGEAAEPLLRDGVKAATRQVFAGARPTRENAFKIALAERTLAAVLAEGER